MSERRTQRDLTVSGSTLAPVYRLSVRESIRCPISDFATWRSALAGALKAAHRFGADALVVPLGVDTFEGDPISRFTLTSADYLQIGRDLSGAGLPTVFTMEGGYAVAEVGVNVVNVLEGFANA